MPEKAIEVPPEDRPCYRVISIEVRKAERSLVATCEEGAVRRYTVALGREREGAKRARDDMRTPEGLYHVAEPPRRSRRFHLFLPIDYPSSADADAALADGRIDEATHDAIAEAHTFGRMPPQDTPLGGLLGFHGEGRRWRGDSEHLDWTTGCIALPDAAIDYLAARARPGTPVRILP